MTKVTKQSVKQLVASVNGAGTISKGYLFSEGKDIYYIRFSNGGILMFNDNTSRAKVFRMLTLELGYDTPESKILTDEVAGICEAAQLGINPFECSVMCNNPELNEVAK